MNNIKEQFSFYTSLTVLLILEGIRVKNYAANLDKQLNLLGSSALLKQPAKRVNIIRLKVVKEGSILYKERRIKTPKDASVLLKHFLGEVD